QNAIVSDTAAGRRGVVAGAAVRGGELAAGQDAPTVAAGGVVGKLGVVQPPRAAAPQTPARRRGAVPDRAAGHTWRGAGGDADGAAFLLRARVTVLQHNTDERHLRGGVGTDIEHAASATAVD